MKELCEGHVTKAECKQALKPFKMVKSPGNNGLSVEFYEFVWEDIADILINCFKDSYNEGALTTSQTQYIITLI